MTIRVRAKFYCSSITYMGYKEVEAIKVLLNPVYSSDPETENYKFWKASPSGQLEMTINNKEAFSSFKVGQEYYIDFTPVGS